MTEFYTPRLHMAPLTMTYLASTHAYAADRENTLYMLYMPKASIEETKKYLSMAERQWAMEQPRCLEFAVLLNAGAETAVKPASETAAETAAPLHIGSLSAFLNEERTSAELGWILAKDCWGKGYGLEAARGLIDYCAERLGIRHFTAHCDSANIPSQKIMEKLGFTLTDASGKRKNRAAEAESAEYSYELSL